MSKTLKALVVKYPWLKYDCYKELLEDIKELNKTEVEADEV